MTDHPMQPFLDLTPEIAAALGKGVPVVALESTLVTHGLPFPRNLDTARALEAEVRAGGAVPATIAVLGGRFAVGLADEALERLARAGRAAAKASFRDLAPLVAAGADAGTTVAATMAIAEAAGIAVFATGGIGGVHRGAETTFDVSADLGELARSRVGVVCAGAKSILDLPKTLEVLETQGVPVVGYGTREFPAFHSRTSGLRLDHCVPDAAAAARALRAALVFGRGGILFVNPLPEAHEIPAAEIEPRLAEATARARAEGVAGKDVTPWLLAKLEELTAGRSVAANMALLRDNARVGAEIAVALARLRAS
ncbi:MAG: pseudouridine-5'-phosphate glycosidase [Hyphomicrobiales bacterium]|nr:pseudouridine-5'-phosphate glycosidase [Hyphomicrobiales bacterium]MDE2017983.1 pseudouridine-5'-phosphate glycosidase [Hyphomicrobiales bacterium]